MVWTGYQLFDLNVSSKEEYDEIYKMLILVGRDKTDGVSEYSEDFRLHEIAVAFETEADISGDVFVNYKGRKSGDDLLTILYLLLNIVYDTRTGAKRE